MGITKGQRSFFTQQLVNWHTAENNRALPWKQEKDPYKIWLSEIILQQTRAEQGLPYYLKFAKTYPTVKHLAAAGDEDAFRLWQGLGYYNRCKNMLATARHIASELKGVFPETYDDIIQLKGVGPYTAAAIASFAYGAPHAVVDGNVYRVLARYFGIDTPFDTTEGKKQFHTLAQELLYTDDSAGYNQAIMDLGATVCTPQKPRCGECPLSAKCTALKHDMTALLPVKSKKLKVKNRYFNYIVFRSGNSIWIRKRTGRDIWENLHEPYLVETETPLNSQTLAKHPRFQALKSSAKPEYAGYTTQRLTHQLIETHFFTLIAEKAPQPALEGGNWVKIADLKNFGFPKTVLSFLEKKFYF